MADLINGRTPEEIKQSLKRCCDRLSCRSEKEGDCSYFVDCLIGVCRMKPMKDALAYIEHLEAQIPKWISVEERLPEPFQCVIVHVRHTKKWRDKELDPSKWWRVVEEDCWSGVNWCGNADEDIHEVTHWMPLPEPPKEENT